MAIKIADVFNNPFNQGLVVASAVRLLPTVAQAPILIGSVVLSAAIENANRLAGECVNGEQDSFVTKKINTAIYLMGLIKEHHLEWLLPESYMHFSSADKPEWYDLFKERFSVRRSRGEESLYNPCFLLEKKSASPVNNTNNKARPDYLLPLIQLKRYFYEFATRTGIDSDSRRTALVTFRMLEKLISLIDNEDVDLRQGSIIAIAIQKFIQTSFMKGHAQVIYKEDTEASRLYGEADGDVVRFLLGTSLPALPNNASPLDMIGMASGKLMTAFYNRNIQTICEEVRTAISTETEKMQLALLQEYKIALPDQYTVKELQNGIKKMAAKNHKIKTLSRALALVKAVDQAARMSNVNDVPALMKSMSTLQNVLQDSDAELDQMADPRTKKSMSVTLHKAFQSSFERIREIAKSAESYMKHLQHEEATEEKYANHSDDNPLKKILAWISHEEEITTPSLLQNIAKNSKALPKADKKSVSSVQVPRIAQATCQVAFLADARTLLNQTALEIQENASSSEVCSGLYLDERIFLMNKRDSLYLQLREWKMNGIDANSHIHDMRDEIIKLADEYFLEQQNAIAQKEEILLQGIQDRKIGALSDVKKQERSHVKKINDIDIEIGVQQKMTPTFWQWLSGELDENIGHLSALRDACREIQGNSQSIRNIIAAEQPDPLSSLYLTARNVVRGFTNDEKLELPKNMDSQTLTKIMQTNAASENVQRLQQYRELLARNNAILDKKKILLESRHQLIQSMQKSWGIFWKMGCWFSGKHTLVKQQLRQVQRALDSLKAEFSQFDEEKLLAFAQLNNARSECILKYARDSNQIQTERSENTNQDVVAKRPDQKIAQDSLQNFVDALFANQDSSIRTFSDVSDDSCRRNISPASAR